jgi:hypothetical protein
VTRALAGAVVAGAVLGLLGPAAGIAGAAGAVIALGFGCGWLVARPLLRDAAPALQILAGLVVSPLVSGGLASLLLLAGVPAPSAARGLLGITAAAAAIVLARQRPEHVADPAPAAALYGPALLWAGLIALFLFANPYLIQRSDAWFHAAVVERMSRLGLPSEDPFFAGLRLLYFWGYHVWATLILALQPQLTVFVPLVAFNLLAAGGTLLAVSLLSLELGATVRGSWLACGLAAFGYYPFSWIWIVARSLTGEVRGWEEIERLTTMGAGAALITMMHGTMHASMVTFADKFLVLTPFSMAHAIFGAFLLAWLRFVQRPGLRRGALLGLVQAAGFFIHSVGGWSQALAGAVAWMWILPGARRDPEGLRRLFGLAATFGLATLVMLPYLWFTTHGKTDSAGLGFTPRALWSLLLAGALYVPTGFAVLAAWARRGTARATLIPMALALVAAALFVRLPENNQSKFLNLLFLLLAAPAALGWSAVADRLFPAARRLVWLAAMVALLPSVALVAWGFASERGQAFDSVPRSTAAEREAFAWARRHTPEGAAFADEGGGEDLVVRAARGALWGGPSYENNWGYPIRDIELRRRAVAQLCGGRPLDAQTDSLVGALRRPVVVVARRRYADQSGSAWATLAEGGAYRLLFANDEVRLFAWTRPEAR